MTSLFPEGLTQKEFNLLNECAHKASSISTTDLINSAKEHLEEVRLAHEENIFINLKLAEAIVNNFSIIIKAWDALPKHSYPWLKGMIRYFCLPSDLESDFSSPIGFDDDVAIMNACLAYAGREDLCLNPEDFDDV